MTAADGARPNGWAVRGIVLAVSLLAAPASLLVAPHAGAATSGACPDASGVTVVVDFHELGGGIVVRCAGPSVRSGADAPRPGGAVTGDGSGGGAMPGGGTADADRSSANDQPSTSAGRVALAPCEL
jgi:hypothetical protein